MDAFLGKVRPPSIPKVRYGPEPPDPSKTLSHSILLSPGSTLSPSLALTQAGRRRSSLVHTVSTITLAPTSPCEFFQLCSSTSIQKGHFFAGI